MSRLKDYNQSVADSERLRKEGIYTEENLKRALMVVICLIGLSIPLWIANEYDPGWFQKVMSFGYLDKQE